ncbi:MAG TPA: alcohol dehydrogenase catalytic domain-containing protein [Bryobacteraceae bacterium]|nr:alcohol dehydrogenase catalytic domain-containing protein [Bryobacteraceae bacterium]
MRAVALDFNERRLIEWDAPAPRILRQDEVLFQVEEVGVCGTDRELALFHLGHPPEGESRLVIGHEAFGRVRATGSAVRSFQPGDCVVPMIRRRCPAVCPSCARGRFDLCTTGQYGERGIYGLHGYFCELAVDSERDLVAVPPELASFAVLAEPLSVVEKAVSMAVAFRQEPAGAALVLGAGPIGLLAALALRLRGLEVHLQSLEPPGHPRARLVRAAGAAYLGPRQSLPPADIVVEATGSAQAAFNAIRALAPLGVCALLGAGEGQGHVSFRDLVVGNRVVFGSVNAGRDSFALAIEDLGRADPNFLNAMVERRPFADFPRSLADPSSGTAKIAHVIR